MHGNEHFNGPQVESILNKADAIVDAALQKAEKVANDAWAKIEDAWEKTFFPGEHRHKERNAKYKGAMNSMIKQAQQAAAAGDYVSAYAIAKSAQALGSLPPYKDWPQISGARVQLTTQAQTLADAYAGKAGAQMEKGKGGEFKPGGMGIGLGLAAGAVAVAALFLSMRKG